MESVNLRYIGVTRFIYSATIMIKVNKKEKVECSGGNDLHKVQCNLFS